jgi:flagellar basal-body rod protein FlgB
MLRDQMTPSVRLAATREGHIQADTGVVPNAQMLYRVPQQPSLDGNTVEAEREQVEYSANAVSYQATLRFLEGKIKGLKTAIRGTVQ